MWSLYLMSNKRTWALILLEHRCVTFQSLLQQISFFRKLKSFIVSCLPIPQRFDKTTPVGRRNDRGENFARPPAEFSPLWFAFIPSDTKWLSVSRLSRRLKLRGHVCVRLYIVETPDAAIWLSVTGSSLCLLTFEPLSDASRRMASCLWCLCRRGGGVLAPSLYLFTVFPLFLSPSLSLFVLPLRLSPSSGLCISVHPCMEIDLRHEYITTSHPCIHPPSTPLLTPSLPASPLPPPSTVPFLQDPSLSTYLKVRISCILIGVSIFLSPSSLLLFFDFGSVASFKQTTTTTTEPPPLPASLPPLFKSIFAISE